MGDSAGHKVISISGDGGLGQYLAEITTAVKVGAKITHIVLNNRQLGKISKEQRVARLDVWQTDLVNPDFAELTKSSGGLGLSVEKPDQLDQALQKRH